MPQSFFSDTLPLNARVSVDFLKKDVKFDYPIKTSKIKSYLSVVMTLKMAYMPFFWLFLAFILISEINLSIVKLNGLLGFLAFMWLIPYFMAFLMMFNRYYIQNWFPRCSFRVRQMALEGYYRVEVTPDKIKDNRFELPLFSNVILKYEAFGELGDALEMIEIREHDIKYKSVFGKLKQQEQLWKAEFYFSRIATSGRLILIFL